MFKKIRQFFIKRATNSELEAEIVKRFSEDVDMPEMADKTRSEILEGMAGVPEIDNYYKALMHADKQRYFSAQHDEQPVIRGAYLRTLHLLKSIRNSRTSQDKVELNNPRYAE